MTAPYIADQRLRVLRPKDGVPRLQDLDVQHSQGKGEAVRETRLGSEESLQPTFGGDWQPADRQLWLIGKLPTDNRSTTQYAQTTVERAPVGLREIVLSEAGEGKSTTLEWLTAKYCFDHPAGAAFLIPVGELPRSAATFIDRTLVDRLLTGVNSITGLSPDDQRGRRVEARNLLIRLACRGELMLAFDGIDQASKAQIEVLAQILSDPAFSSCRFVLAGRPYALNMHWEKLFKHKEFAPGWRFLLLEQFNETQQRRYLGKDQDGIDRYDKVPVEARPLLSAPRVLYYLGSLHDEQFAELHTPSDVFWLATRRMLAEGLAGSKPTAKVDADDIQMLLAAIAYTMIANVDEPNFARVAGGHALKELGTAVRGRIETHWSELDRKVRLPEAWWKRSLKQLAALNAVVQFGFLEQNIPQQVQFRDRGLQEFFAGLWLSLYASQQDVDRLWGLVYLPKEAATRGYYWMWRYAAEMPVAARPQAKARLNHWARSLGVLFRPGDGTACGTKRSNELIFRAWRSMQAYCATDDAYVKRVLGAWQSEFETVILDGNWSHCETLLGRSWGDASNLIDDNRGDNTWQRAEAQRRARQFVDCFVLVPAGYGPTDEMASRQPPDMSQWVNPRWIDAFYMNRCPTLNAWMRLYDPGHGRLVKYAHVSSSQDHPALGIDWYTAWAYCKWARWNEQCCRLPLRNEWLYAANAGIAPITNFWWGEMVDVSRLTFTPKDDESYEIRFDELESTRELVPVDPYPQLCHYYFKTEQSSSLDPETPPGQHPHDNPWGFRDIVGNVWEWTETAARRWKSHPERRILLGGAWDSEAAGLGSYAVTGVTNDSIVFGFRVARASCAVDELDDFPELPNTSQ